MTRRPPAQQRKHPQHATQRVNNAAFTHKERAVILITFGSRSDILRFQLWIICNSNTSPLISHRYDQQAATGLSHGNLTLPIQSQLLYSAPLSSTGSFAITAFAMRETTVESHLITSTLSHTIENIDTPPIISPPRSKTPPLAASKRNILNGQMAERATSESLDPVVLSRALKDFEDGGRQRERTPGGSPSRKKQKVYGDRFVKLLPLR